MQNDMAGLLQKHNDTIFRMSEGRFQMGKIAENDLLQAELNKLNSDISYERSSVELSLARMRLEQFLNSPLEAAEPVVDTAIIPVQVNLEKAVTLARENLSDYTDYELQQILGERSIAQAQAENRPTFSLFGTYGLTQSGTTFDQSLQNPQESQLLLVRLDVPVYQFGLNRARTEQAKLNQEIRMDQLELQRISLEQNIYQKVTNFMLLQDQVAIARRADEVSDKGYEVTRQRFMIGKIDLLELNNAVARRTQARMDYVNTLRDYWMAYYEIRKLCHYDFKNNTPLTHE
jgi:outer membrane protein